MEARMGRDPRREARCAARQRNAGTHKRLAIRAHDHTEFALLRRSKLFRQVLNLTISPCSKFMEYEVEQLPQASNAAGTNVGQSPPLPGTEAYEALPQFPKHSPLPSRRTIRRHELRQIVPLAETTIYEMEQRGEFPRRFRLTARCVVWDLEEVEAWIEDRKQASRSAKSAPSAGPDVKLRRYRPVR